MENNLILLAEDNARDEALTLRAFASSGVDYKVMVVRDGLEALDYLFGLETNKKNVYSAPKLVLLDLKMPKLDGLQVLQRIRSDKRTQYQPIVIFTSSNERDDILNSYRLGANSFVRKPIDFDEYASAIHLIMKYWLVVNRVPASGKSVNINE